MEHVQMWRNVCWRSMIVMPMPLVTTLQHPTPVPVSEALKEMVEQPALARVTRLAFMVYVLEGQIMYASVMLDGQGSAVMRTVDVTITAHVAEVSAYVITVNTGAQDSIVSCASQEAMEMLPAQVVTSARVMDMLMKNWGIAILSAESVTAETTQQEGSVNSVSKATMVIQGMAAAVTCSVSSVAS